MRATVIKYGEMAGAFTAILIVIAGIFTFFNADLPPYAAMVRAQSLDDKISDTAKVQKQDIETVKREQSIMSRALLRLDRTYWEKQLADAEADLIDLPQSFAARNAIRDARAQIAFIDEQLKPGRGTP